MYNIVNFDQEILIMLWSAQETELTIGQAMRIKDAFLDRWWSTQGAAGPEMSEIGRCTWIHMRLTVDRVPRCEIDALSETPGLTSGSVDKSWLVTGKTFREIPPQRCALARREAPEVRVAMPLWQMEFSFPPLLCYCCCVQKSALQNYAWNIPTCCLYFWIQYGAKKGIHLQFALWYLQR